MKPQFNIHTPLSVADVENIRRRNDRKIRVTQWFSLPVAVGALVIGWLVWYLISDINPYSYLAIEQSIVLWSILSPVIGFMACALVLTIWNYWHERLHEAKSLLSPIPLSDSEAALSLTKQYADLDAYRMAVIVQRQITAGDFEAMKSFAKQQEIAAAARALEEKQKESFRQLHEAG